MFIIIVEEINVAELKCQYFIARVFPKDRDQDEWTAEFVFSYFLTPCIKVSQWSCESVIIQYSFTYLKAIERQYPKECYEMIGMRTNFTNPTATLSYTSTPADGWALEPEMIAEVISVSCLLFHHGP